MEGYEFQTFLIHALTFLGGACRLPHASLLCMAEPTTASFPPSLPEPPAVSITAPLAALSSHKCVNREYVPAAKILRRILSTVVRNSHLH